ncbi:Phage minor capsid protein 2 [Tissierella praeacuta DSM 18095]|uniref:Phage minor capsid protein 2 n=2 Tax=Tissierella praeacuta TaxID=43131 RepID=A0A1M4ZB87_9FIRM|nr:minor capsid protein 2 [Tissierella praeacuta]SHF15291.1 Phage minor capsid protein 2 [Tissierella praeacuta DSM 18095]
MMKNKKQKDEAYNIRKIYEQMELELIASVKRNLSRHQEEEQKVGFKFEQWQSAKLRDLERFRKENRKIIDKYDTEIKNSIQIIILNTYKNAQDNVNRFIMKIKIFINKLINKTIDDVYIKFPGDLEPILKDIENFALDPLQETIERVLENARIWEEAPRPIDDVFFRSNDDKFKALMETVENDFKKANAAVLRRMDDVYRQTIFKTQVHYNTGTITLDKAIDMATKDFLEKGIDAITYSDGKKVNIASYVEMALRTTNHRAYLMGEGKRRQEIGIPFVVASAHATACELCVPWQGKILIDDVYSGGKKEDGPYPLLSEAMEKGFLHPNCRHNLSTYFPGITTLPKVPDEEKALENYKYEQQQRYIERQIRKYKRLAEGSIDENSQKKYQDKVKEYQKVMREHLKENPQLRRAYNREQTKGVPYDFSKYDELSGLITEDNITIEGISHHLKERVIEREISAKSIEDALKNPLNIGKIKYDKQNRPSIEYIGNNARVQINPETGNIITVWRTSSKLRNKYMGDKNGKD